MLTFSAISTCNLVEGDKIGIYYLNSNSTNFIIILTFLRFKEVGNIYPIFIKIYYNLT